MKPLLAVVIVLLTIIALNSADISVEPTAVATPINYELESTVPSLQEDAPLADSRGNLAGTETYAGSGWSYSGYDCQNCGKSKVYPVSYSADQAVSAPSASAGTYGAFYGSARGPVRGLFRRGIDRRQTRRGGHQGARSYRQDNRRSGRLARRCQNC